MDKHEYLCNAIFILSGKITIATMVIPIIVAIVRRSYLNQVLKIFLIYCIATLGINLLELSYVTAVNNYREFFKSWLEFTDGSTSFFFILYQLKEFILLGWFYSILFSRHGHDRWIKIISGVLIIGSIIAYIFEQGWRNYSTFGPNAEAIYVVLIPLFYLIYLVRDNLTLPLTKNPFFWISLGLAIPKLFGLFLHFVGDAIYEADFCLFTRFGTAKNGFEVIGQILLTIGFLQSKYAKYIQIPGEEATT